MAILEYLMNTEVVSSKGKQLEMMGLQLESLIRDCDKTINQLAERGMLGRVSNKMTSVYGAIQPGMSKQMKRIGRLGTAVQKSAVNTNEMATNVANAMSVETVGAEEKAAKNGLKRIKYQVDIINKEIQKEFGCVNEKVKKYIENSMIQVISSGKTLNFPERGEQVEYNDGDRIYNLPVNEEDVWSVEFDYETAKSNYRLIAIRMKKLLDTYSNNNGEESLLVFQIPGYGECYAGAMVEGYGEIGDIVNISLEDGGDFNFIIVDVKNTHHSHDQLAENQVQNEKYGHGYLKNNKTSIGMCTCEFLLAGWKYKNENEKKEKEYSAKAYTTKLNLNGNHVSEAQIIGHINIIDGE